MKELKIAGTIMCIGILGLVICCAGVAFDAEAAGFGKWFGRGKNTECQNCKNPQAAPPVAVVEQVPVVKAVLPRVSLDVEVGPPRTLEKYEAKAPAAVPQTLEKLEDKTPENTPDYLQHLVPKQAASRARSAVECICAPLPTAPVYNVPPATNAGLLRGRLFSRR